MAKKKIVEKAPREMTHRQLSHHKKQIRRQRFIFFGGIGIIVAVVLILVAGWLFGDYLPLHKNVLQVYDAKFNTAYFIDRLELVLRSQNANNSDVNTIADSVVNQILQGELEIQTAANLGVKVSDADIITLLKNNSVPVNAASKDAAAAQLLGDKLKSDYFNKIIPASDNQVYLKAIMAEDESLANIVRGRMMNGDNITALAEEYAQGYFSQSYKGDFGFHSAPFFSYKQIPAVPLKYAFGEDAKTGTVSPVLPDIISYKQLGYWVVRVNDRPSDVTANVTAIYFSNRIEALTVKAQLEAGDNVTALADQYSQYSRAQGKHGELDIISPTDNVSEAFYAYVTNPSTKLGEWSSPIRDTTNWTQGGFWVVQVVDRQDYSKVSDEDRKTLVDQGYSDWANGLMAPAAGNVYNNFSDKLKQWAIDRAVKKIQIASG